MELDQTQGESARPGETVTVSCEVYDSCLESELDCGCADSPRLREEGKRTFHEAKKYAMDQLKKKMDKIREKANTLRESVYMKEGSLE